MNTPKKKVAIAMSGGVDSSVAAYLLKEQGYDVAGFFMRFWFEDGVEDLRSHRCCTIEEYMAAHMVAEKLDMPLYTLNFEQKFKEDIVDDFLGAYEEGLTPNPCVRCNQFVKFGAFIQKAQDLGFDMVATGHYAKLEQDENGAFYVVNAEDTEKDQTYFLHRLDQQMLQYVMFPVGHLTKPEVREVAGQAGLVTAQKKSSADLCFVANNDLKGFLSRNMEFKVGDICDVDTGEVLGQHEGLLAYTIGQRKGLGLAGGPWYVVRKDLHKNIVFVTRDKNHKKFFHGDVILEDVNWLLGSEPTFPYEVDARTRYNQPTAPAILNKNEDGEVILTFPEPRRSITPGQSAVFYKDGIMIGGGMISKKTLRN